MLRLAVVDYLNYCRIVGCRFFAYSTLEHCMRNHSAAGEQNRSVMVLVKAVEKIPDSLFQQDL
jgi:hypothetical protein